MDQPKKKGCNHSGDDSHRHHQETAKVARFFQASGARID
jgi:hypothetical protein